MSSAAVDEREINERHGAQPLETYKSVRSLRYCCYVYMGVEAGWTGSGWTGSGVRGAFFSGKLSRQHLPTSVPEEPLSRTAGHAHTHAG